MTKATRLKAKYVVNAMVGADESDGHNAVVAFFMKAAHSIRAWWWIQKVNHMSEGEILNMYYLLTDGAQ